MLPKYFGTVILVFLIHVLMVNCYSGSSKLSKRNAKSRQKRFDLLALITEPSLNFYFEYNSCYALAVVISIPLELPAGRSVFFSYNFETNYYYAYFDHAQGLTPLPFTIIDEPGSNLGTKNRVPPGFRRLDDGAEIVNEATNKTEQISEEKSRSHTMTLDDATSNSTEAKKSESKKKQTKEAKEKLKNRKIRSLLQNYFMSRRRFYKMMESKIDRSGLKGRDCLLRAICETAAEKFGQHNGVIGSIVDILFLPSASKDEKLPKKYYKAEANGRLRNCNIYNKMCPSGIFDFISTII